MKFLKISLAAVFILSCFSAAVFADYKSDILNGNKAYKEKKWGEASGWYRKAYKEKPSNKLKTLILALDRKAGAESPASAAVVTQKEPEKPLDLGPVLLVALDVALAGAAGYMVYLEGNAEEDYNEMYAELNNTTPANYDLLVKKQKETYMIMTLEAVALSAASAAIIYTLGDLFFTHEIFKQDVSVKTGISRDIAYLKIERSF